MKKKDKITSTCTTTKQVVPLCNTIHAVKLLLLLLVTKTTSLSSSRRRADASSLVLWLKIIFPYGLLRRERSREIDSEGGTLAAAPVGTLDSYIHPGLYPPQASPPRAFEGEAALTDLHRWLQSYADDTRKRRENGWRGPEGACAKPAEMEKKKQNKKIKAHPVQRWRIKSAEIRATYRKFEFHTFQAAFRGIKAILVQRKWSGGAEHWLLTGHHALKFDLRCIINVFHFVC